MRSVRNPLPEFLSSGPAALAWAKENIDLSSIDRFEIDEDLPDELREELQEDIDKEILKLARKYSKYAAKVFAAGEAKVYRMIRVESLKHIDMANLGPFWSMKKSHAGVYGHPEEMSKHIDVLMTGIVDPEEINWAHGFDMFVTYGEDESEVTLRTKAPVLLIALDDKGLDPPVLGNVGHGHFWGWK